MSKNFWVSDLSNFCSRARQVERKDHAWQVALRQSLSVTDRAFAVRSYLAGGPEITAIAYCGTIYYRLPAIGRTFDESDVVTGASLHPAAAEVVVLDEDVMAVVARTYALIADRCARHQWRAPSRKRYLTYLAEKAARRLEHDRAFGERCERISTRAAEQSTASTTSIAISCLLLPTWDGAPVENKLATVQYNVGRILELPKTDTGTADPTIAARMASEASLREPRTAFAVWKRAVDETVLQAVFLNGEIFVEDERSLLQRAAMRNESEMTAV